MHMDKMRQDSRTHHIESIGAPETLHMKQPRLNDEHLLETSRLRRWTGHDTPVPVAADRVDEALVRPVAPLSPATDATESRPAILEVAPTLSIDEERSLGWAIVNENCPLARERLFVGSLPVLTRIANAYEGRGLEFPALIEAGSLGLRRAVHEFDPAQGVRFSTCASWWIKQSIRNAMRLTRISAPA